MTKKRADVGLKLTNQQAEIKLIRLKTRRSFLGTVGIGLAGSASLLCAPSAEAKEKAKAKTKQSDFKMGHGDKDHQYPNDKD
jgi:hypothetical protein